LYIMPIVPPTPENIEKAAAAIRAGELVAFPTETVYGLGADATNGRAVAAIFAAKARPRFNPLIVHVASLEVAEGLAVLGPIERGLAERFWPGALTLVLLRRDESAIADLTTAGLDTLALRVPSHPVAQALLRAAQRPIAAPSANRSGHVSATCAEHVMNDLGDRVALVLDDGPTRLGLESTIVSVRDGEILLLRPGAIPAEGIEEATRRPVARGMDTAGKPTSPGQLASHYAPRARLRLDAADVQPGEALLAFGPSAPACTGSAINLSPTGDLLEAATNLFAALRRLDTSGAARIAVMPIPRDGLGEAINDRLQRAAAPR
jgi:L-threonylcarbamoyladenylate synthase